MTSAAPQTTPRGHNGRVSSTWLCPAPPDASRVRAQQGLIARPRLSRRLLGSRDVPLVLLAAPAGYGKTTLLGEWAAQESRPVAWVDACDADNDPARLSRSISDALLEAGLPGKDPSETLAHSDGGLVLVVDGAHAVHAAASLELLQDLVGRLGRGVQLAIASRAEPRLGLGALRARRKLLELRPADLAMTRSEIAVLMEASGLHLERRELDRLARRTEGWPAGLYLALLAAREDPFPGAALETFSGADRFVADYLGEEVFAALPAGQLSFLRRTSVLDTLSGPICDFVLERSDSARRLKDLSRMSLMLVALDRSDESYRHHRLFAQTLRGELRRWEPEVEPDLHARASIWYGERGDVDRSIEHAIAAADVDRVGDLLWSHAASLLGYGQLQKLERWLACFSDEQIAGSSKLALVAAVRWLTGGDRDRAELWTAAALRALSPVAPGARRRSLEAHIVLLRAAVAEDRVDRMADEAETACADMPEDSPWHILGWLLQGVGRHLAGERERARRCLEEGARRGSTAAPNMQSLCLAQLALLAIERDDWGAAESLAARAKAQTERNGLGAYPTSALVYAVSADVLARVGRVEAAQADVRHASRLLSVMAGYSAWHDVECSIALGRAMLRLSDLAATREVLDAAEAQLHFLREADVARSWIEDCRAQADRSSSSAARSWCLTTAELRILQFLPTHLSFPEMADRLFVSANTVKTHARSVYRKLGASSRGEAVVRAREAGLLDAASQS